MEIPALINCKSMYKFKTHLWLSVLFIILSGKVFSQISPPSGTPQQANLQVYYPFDVTTPVTPFGMTGQQWSEFKTEAINGTSFFDPAANGISLGNLGIKGNSLYSDGTSSSAASFNQNNLINSIINSTNSFTISFWYKPNDDTNTTNSSIIGRRDLCSDSSNQGQNTFFDIRAIDPTTSNQGRVSVEIEEHQTTTGPNWLSNSTGASINNTNCNEWIHCVVTRSLSNNNLSTTRLYIDGALMDTDISRTVNIGIGESGVFEIGGSACINQDGTRRFSGYFDELMVYNLELTQIEVAMLYQAYTPNLNVNVSGTKTICIGQSTTLTANVSGSSGSGYNYLWSPSGQTTQSITVTPNTTTIYTVNASNSECEVSIPVTVNILPIPILDPVFTANVQCKGYDGYTVSLIGTGPGTHNWQVYTGSDLTTPVGNEIPSLSIYGTSQFNITIDIAGIAGDNFVIKHTVLDTCAIPVEHKQLITLPCYKALSTAFDLTYSCDNNTPKIKVKGAPNPCNTKWFFDLFNGNTFIERIDWTNNNSGEYNNSEYTFNSELEPCTEYIVKHNVWNDCNTEKETIQSVTTTDCPKLVADFQFQNAQGEATNTFYTCDDFGIFFNGTASQNENRYYIDIWKFNDAINDFDWLARKNNSGWTYGQAGIFDLFDEFNPKGVDFSPGTYKVKLAVANNCNGWLPVEKTFTIVESIGNPVLSFGTYHVPVGNPVATNFILGNDIWVRGPLSGNPPNNLTN